MDDIAASERCGVKWITTKDLQDIKPYKTYKEEISYDYGLMFKGTKLIIPKSMQPKMIKIDHESHLGIGKSKQMARDTMFWPGMTSQIEDISSCCETCQSNRNNP